MGGKQEALTESMYYVLLSLRGEDRCGTEMATIRAKARIHRVTFSTMGLIWPTASLPAMVFPAHSRVAVTRKK